MLSVRAGALTVHFSMIKQKVKSPQKEFADILLNHKRQRSELIPLLQKVQERLGYISKETMGQVADHLKLSASEVFGVATFFSQFRFTKPGRHTVKVCLGTACHVRGGEKILDFVQDELKVEPGGTTQDGRFSLERIACFGCCALAPVVVIDDDVYGKITPSKVKKLLTRYG